MADVGQGAGSHHDVPAIVLTQPDPGPAQAPAAPLEDPAALSLLSPHGAAEGAGGAKEFVMGPELRAAHREARNLCGLAEECPAGADCEVLEEHEAVKSVQLLMDGLVGDTYHPQHLNIIKAPQLLGVACHVVAYLPLTQAAELLQALQILIQRCSRNQLVACRVNLIGHLLWLLHKASKSNVLLGHIVTLMHLVFSFSISVVDLWTIFSLLHVQSRAAVTPHHSALVTLLHKLFLCGELEGPLNFFDLAGDESGLALPTLSSFPSSRGLSVSMWVRVESFEEQAHQPQSDPYRPRLFSFSSASGEGVELLLTGAALTYQVAVPDQKQPKREDSESKMSPERPRRATDPPSQPKSTHPQRLESREDRSGSEGGLWAYVKNPRSWSQGRAASGSSAGSPSAFVPREQPSIAEEEGEQEPEERGEGGQGAARENEGEAEEEGGAEDKEKGESHGPEEQGQGQQLHTGTHQFKFCLTPRKWHHICITHKAAAQGLNALFRRGVAKSEVKLYVDGVLVDSTQSLQHLPKTQLEHCYIGCAGTLPCVLNPLGNRHPLFGQIASVVVFDDIVLAPKVEAIAKAPPAQHTALAGDPDRIRIAIDAYALTAPSQSLAHRKGSSSYEEHTLVRDIAHPHGARVACARLFKDVMVARRCSVVHGMPAVGGVRVVLPLFQQLSWVTPAGANEGADGSGGRARSLSVEEEGEIARRKMAFASGAPGDQCCQLLLLLQEICNRDPQASAQLLEHEAVDSIAHLLVDCSHHLTLSVVWNIKNLADNLELLNTPHSTKLARELIVKLLLDFEMWGAASFDAQDEVYDIGVALCQATPRPSLVPVPTLLFLLSTLVSGEKSPAPRARGRRSRVSHPRRPAVVPTNPTLTDSQVATLRSRLVHMITAMVVADPLEDDLKSILLFLHTSTDTAAVASLLLLVLSVVCSNATARARVRALGGHNLFLAVLFREDMTDRVLALAFVGARVLVEHTRQNKKQTARDLDVCCSVMKRATQGAVVAQELYSALLSYSLVEAQHWLAINLDLALAGGEVFRNNSLVTVVLSAVVHADWEVRMRALQDLATVVGSNPLNSARMLNARDVPFLLLRLLGDARAYVDAVSSTEMAGGADRELPAELASQEVVWERVVRLWSSLYLTIIVPRPANVSAPQPSPSSPSPSPPASPVAPRAADAPAVVKFPNAQHFLEYSLLHIQNFWGATASRAAVLFACSLFHQIFADLAAKIQQASAGGNAGQLTDAINKPEDLSHLLVAFVTFVFHGFPTPVATPSLRVDASLGTWPDLSAVLKYFDLVLVVRILKGHANLLQGYFTPVTLPSPLDCALRLLVASLRTAVGHVIASSCVVPAFRVGGMEVRGCGQLIAEAVTLRRTSSRLLMLVDPSNTTLLLNLLGSYLTMLRELCDHQTMRHEAANPSDKGNSPHLASEGEGHGGDEGEDHGGDEGGGGGNGKEQQPQHNVDNNKPGDGGEQGNPEGGDKGEGHDEGRGERGGMGPVLVSVLTDAVMDILSPRFESVLPFLVDANGDALPQNMTRSNLLGLVDAAERVALLTSDKWVHCLEQGALAAAIKEVRRKEEERATAIAATRTKAAKIVGQRTRNRLAKEEEAANDKQVVCERILMDSEVQQQKELKRTLAVRRVMLTSRERKWSKSRQALSYEWRVLDSSPSQQEVPGMHWKLRARETPTRERLWLVQDHNYAGHALAELRQEREQQVAALTPEQERAAAEAFKQYQEKLEARNRDQGDDEEEGADGDVDGYGDAEGDGSIGEGSRRPRDEAKGSWVESEMDADDDEAEDGENYESENFGDDDDDGLRSAGPDSEEGAQVAAHQGEELQGGLPERGLDQERTPNHHHGEEFSGDSDDDKDMEVLRPRHDEVAVGDEKVEFWCECEHITPLSATTGRFVLTKDFIHFLADPHQEVESELQQLLKDQRKAELAKKTDGAAPGFDKEVWQRRPKSKRFPLHDLREALRRRFLLVDNAMELFFHDGRSCFLVFGDTRVQLVFRKMLALSPLHIVQRQLLGPRDLFKRNSAATQAWASGAMSNFDYLMYLNTIAGRTYADLNQYPVFPWVLTDYTSSKLDLSNPDVFRDLSKPIGALNPQRSEGIVERYKSHNEEMGMPRFHYGSHYSTAGIVLFYLLRLEPYTTWNISLQGGKFDVPERLFSSVHSAWTSSYSNTNDFKELIPEFFYNPHFLRNTNQLPLGYKDSGKPVGHVGLPPWAESPLDFVQKHREALESEFVSDNLHHWIDLVFGCKQRGKAAEQALNVFYYLTYEGAVDINAIDPGLRDAIVQQAKYFGQTPSQLLRSEPHPRRARLAVPRMLFSECQLVKLFMIEQWIANSPPLISIVLTPVAAICVAANGSYGVFEWVTPSERPKPAPASASPTLPFALQLTSLDTRTIPLDPLQITTGELGSLAKFGGVMEASEREVVAAVTFSGRYLVFGRRWDNSMLVVNTSTGKTVQTLRAHTGVVECVVVASPKGRALLSGGRDCRVAVWGFIVDATRAMVGVNAWPQHQAALTDADKRLPVSSQPLRFLHGHRSWVVCVAANTDLDTVVSAGLDGLVLVHTFSKGKLMRKLVPAVPSGVQGPDNGPVPQTDGDVQGDAVPEGGRCEPKEREPLHREDGGSQAVHEGDYVSHINLSFNGHIVLYTHKSKCVSHFTMDGRCVGAISVGEDVTALCLAPLARHLLIAKGRRVHVHDLHNKLEHVHRFNIEKGTVHCMANRKMGRELHDFVFCGLSTGHMVVMHNNSTPHPSPLVADLLYF